LKKTRAEGIVVPDPVEGTAAGKADKQEKDDGMLCTFGLFEQAREVL
jgi:hypothetical protein